MSCFTSAGRLFEVDDRTDGREGRVGIGGGDDDGIVVETRRIRLNRNHRMKITAEKRRERIKMA